MKEVLSLQARVLAIFSVVFFLIVVIGISSNEARAVSIGGRNAVMAVNDFRAIDDSIDSKKDSRVRGVSIEVVDRTTLGGSIAYARTQRVKGVHVDNFKVEKEHFDGVFKFVQLVERKVSRMHRVMDQDSSDVKGAYIDIVESPADIDRSSIAGSVLHAKMTTDIDSSSIKGSIAKAKLIQF